MFVNIPLILFAYITLSLILSLNLAIKWKCFWGALVLLSAGRLGIMRYFWGGLGGIEVPKVPLYITSFFQGTVFILFFLLVLLDLIYVLTFLFNFSHHKELGLFFRSSLKSIPCAWVLLIVSSLISSYALYEAARVPDIKHTKITLKKWPQNLDGLRVVIISDLHLSRFFDQAWATEVTQKVNSLDPELVLIPGDLVDGEKTIRYPDVEPLRGLKSHFGVFMSVGNHEYISQIEDWLPVFRELGIRNLYNQHTVVNIQGTDIILAGVTDPTAQRRGLPTPDLDRALKGVPLDGPPVILLDHRPAHAIKNALDGRVDLQISGHTHGGAIPLVATFIKTVNSGFLKGWYQVGDLQMYLHPGTGLWSGFPMRLFNPSEITLLKIHAPLP
ncbi:MAG: metallophosphoesterase [Deltaproteobacteria bacterium]|jgi:predicted MPP superfamily phosphohydrolase|nr:metallophosphoesterase [Deltaproteobacteria bacterium]